MATAPYCNVPTTAPDASPTQPKGFVPLAPNATLGQVITAVNSLGNIINNLIKNADTPGASNFITRKGANDAVKDALKKLHFIVQSGSPTRKKVRVENPDDPSQYIIDDRVQRLQMYDKETGATWEFSDPRVGDTNANSGG